MKPLPPGNLWLVHLRRLRAQQRLTVRALAERADLTAATVSWLENLRQSTHPITAQALADALGVEVSELLGEEEEPPDADSSQGRTANAEPAA